MTQTNCFVMIFGMVIMGVLFWYANMGGIEGIELWLKERKRRQRFPVRPKRIRGQKDD